MEKHQHLYLPTNTFKDHQHFQKALKEGSHHAHFLATHLQEQCRSSKTTTLELACWTTAILRQAKVDWCLPHSLLPIFWQFSSTYQLFLSSLAGITSRLSRKARRVTWCYVSRQTCHLFPTSHSECLARKKKKSDHHLCGCSLPPPKNK